MHFKPKVRGGAIRTGKVLPFRLHHPVTEEGMWDGNYVSFHDLPLRNSNFQIKFKYFNVQVWLCQCSNVLATYSLVSHSCFFAVAILLLNVSAQVLILGQVL